MSISSSAHAASAGLIRRSWLNQFAVDGQDGVADPLGLRSELCDAGGQIELSGLAEWAGGDGVLDPSVELVGVVE